MEREGAPLGKAAKRRGQPSVPQLPWMTSVSSWKRRRAPPLKRLAAPFENAPPLKRGAPP
jgi:hypothetical protein